MSTIAVTSTRNKQNKNRQSMQVKGTYRRCFERRNAINDVTKEHIAVCCSSTLLNRFAAKTQQSLCLLRNRPMTEKKFTKVATLTDEIYNRINTLERLLVRKSQD